MNQILETNLNNKNKKNHKNKYNLNFLLKFQLFFSIFLILIIGFYFGYSKFNLYKEEKYSNKIIDNYNITKLYANYSNSYNNTTSENPLIVGIIEIPIINIYYPVFSTYNDELLKSCPCRFYGPLPGKIGNLCIAGHNYDNNKFFSNISSLKKDDEIFLYNYYNKKFCYSVFDIYEVKYDDLSPVYYYDKNSKLLTLITCNNVNNNRIIVKAICK